MVGQEMMLLFRCVLLAACLVGLAMAQTRTPASRSPSTVSLPWSMTK
jgi:hypothetical protein